MMASIPRCMKVASLRVLVFACLLQCYANLVATESVKDDDFIDPFDLLNFDSVNMRMKGEARLEKQTMTPIVEGNKQPKQPVLSTVPQDTSCEKWKMSHETAIKLLQQYVMTLVRVMETKVPLSSEPTHLDLRARVSYHDLGRMRRFGEGTDISIHSVHEVLASLVQSATSVQVKSGIEQRVLWLEDRLGLSTSMVFHVTLLVTASAVAIVLIYRLRVTRGLVWRLIFVAFFISVILNMAEMYQGKLAEQEELLMKGMKENCPQQEDISFWQSFSSVFMSYVTFEDDVCKSYMKAMFISPVLTVSPMEAIARSLVKAVVTPMDLIGEGIKKFLVGLLKDMPVQYQTFILTCLLVLVMLLPLLLSGYNFNFFHLINIGPGQQNIQYVHAMPGLANSERHLSIDNADHFGNSLNDQPPSTRSLASIPQTALCEQPLANNVRERVAPNRTVGLSRSNVTHTSTAGRQSQPNARSACILETISVTKTLPDSSTDRQFTQAMSNRDQHRLNTPAENPKLIDAVDVAYSSNNISYTADSYSQPLQNSGSSTTHSSSHAQTNSEAESIITSDGCNSVPDSSNALSKRLANVSISEDAEIVERCVGDGPDPKICAKIIDRQKLQELQGALNKEMQILKSFEGGDGIGYNSSVGDNVNKLMKENSSCEKDIMKSSVGGALANAAEINLDCNIVENLKDSDSSVVTEKMQKLKITQDKTGGVKQET